MALKPETLQFIVQQLNSANYKGFQGIVAQLFAYLDVEIKDNPIYDQYESERTKWQDWPGEDGRGGWPIWKMPGTIEEGKSLAYDIYKTIAENDQNYLLNLATSLFQKSKYSEGLYELNKSFLGYLAQALDDIVAANPEIADNTPKHVPGTTVFIVHGHDEALKTELQLLLTRAGVYAIVLHEQPDMGRTIIDKLVEESGVAGYAIALLTPDDLTNEGNGRARQNVILEIGYFLGKVGKARLRMLVKEGVEIPSDLQGILYEKHDSSGAWKMKLLKEMRAVGIYVDLEAVIMTL